MADRITLSDTASVKVAGDVLTLIERGQPIRVDRHHAAELAGHFPSTLPAAVGDVGIEWTGDRWVLSQSHYCAVLWPDEATRFAAVLREFCVARPGATK